MSLIIAATDFSPVGDNAVRYACNMAKAFGASIKVIHSFVFPLIFSDVPMPASLYSDTESDTDNKMRDHILSLEGQFPDLRIDGKVYYGALVDIAGDLDKEGEKPWMLVIGRNGIGDDPIWSENPLIDTLRSVPYPVMAIPPDATFHPVKKILFAFDNKHKGNDKAIAQLADIAGKFGAELDILNAQRDVHNQDNQVNIDDSVKAQLAGLSPRYHIMYEVETDKAIHGFIEENGIDLLAIITRRHSMFEALFHKSHSKSLSRTSRIPILALHESMPES